MIYLLNANMIDSTASNMICSSATNIVDSVCQEKHSKGVPVAFPNVNGRGDLSTRFAWSR